jgi:hypothetical protein
LQPYAISRKANGELVSRRKFNPEHNLKLSLSNKGEALIYFSLMNLSVCTGFMAISLTLHPDAYLSAIGIYASKTSGETSNHTGLNPIVPGISMR